MKTIIILTHLKIWSIDNKVGAPSFYKTIEGYLNDGWLVYLITSEQSSNFSNCENFNQICVKDTFPAFSKIPVLRFFVNKVNYLLSINKYTRNGAKVIKNLSYREDIILYAYEVHGVKSSKILSMKYRIPLVNRFQGTILPSLQNSLVNRILYYPHYGALKTTADCIIMTDDGTQGEEYLHKIGNKSEKIFFWRNGVDIVCRDNINETRKLLERKYKINKSELLFVTLSRLIEWKKVDRALDLLRGIIDSKISAHLIIIGDGPSKQKLENHARELSIHHKVTFTGAIERDLIQEYLGSADFFLSFYDLSNVGNPLLEAMKCGKTIITLNNGDTGKLVQHFSNGLIYDYFDTKVIIADVINLINNRDLKNRISTNAKNYANEHFISWNDRISNELEVVRNLLWRNN